VSSGELGPATDPQPIGEELMLDTERPKPCRHGGEAIALFHPQLRGAPYECLSVRGGRRNEKDRKLIDRKRHEPFGHGDALERTAAHLDVGHRFRIMSTRSGAREHANLRAHELQQLEKSRTCGIDADIGEPQRPLGGECSGHEKEGRRGEVRRHGERGAVERLSALELDHAVALTELHAEVAQHALGVIPRWRGLADCGTPAGCQPGEE